MLRVGYAEVDITPTLPCRLGGYADRSGPAASVHDPLLVRALVIDQDETRLGLLVADLVAVSADLCGCICHRVRLAPDHLIVAATHTHSGPEVPPMAEEARATVWWHTLSERLAGAYSAATESLQPAIMTFGKSPVNGVGANRHDPKTPGPRTVQVLRFTRPDGRPLGVVIQYPCHPTVLGSANLRVSADYPGALLRDPRVQRLGWAMYVNGAAGDVSTRFTRRAQDFGEVSRMGEILAEAALQAVGAAVSTNVRGLAAGRTALTASLRKPPARETSALRVAAARERLAKVERQGGSHAEVRRAAVDLQGAQIEAELENRIGHLEQSIAITAWALGHTVSLVAIPGELFSALGDRITSHSPFRHTLALGYAGGYAGYFPDEPAYEQHVYEALATHWAPGTGERIADASVNLLGALRRY